MIGAQHIKVPPKTQQHIKRAITKASIAATITPPTTAMITIIYVSSAPTK